jgi:hypothetical protein
MIGSFELGVGIERFEIWNLGFGIWKHPSP